MGRRQSTPLHDLLNVDRDLREGTSVTVQGRSLGSHFKRLRLPVPVPRLFDGGKEDDPRPSECQETPTDRPPVTEFL